MAYPRITSNLQRLVAVCVVATIVGALLLPAVPVHAGDKASETTSIQGSIENGMNDPSMENFGCMTSGSDVPIQGCFAMLAYYFMKLCMWGAAVVAVFLNWVLMELVYGMGQLVGNMPGVMVAWQVLRDVTNVFLVFLTVFIGIAMILGVSSYGSKSLLWKVLLAALLVNFSGTFTKVVIDVSNALALNLNTLILKAAGQQESCKPEDWLAASSYGEKGQDCINNGIAGAFWSEVKVTSVFNVSNMGNTKVTKNIVQAMMLTGIMGGIMFIVLAFVLGIGAFMLIARFVTLVFLIIVSPMAFVFWLTGTGIAGMGAKWWHSLINNSLTAPLLLLMWWMSLKMFSGLEARFDVKGAGMNDAALEMSNIGNYGIFVFFLIVMGFLLASIIMAQKLSAAGANAAVKHATAIAKGGGRFTGDVLLGGTARGLQAVGGRIGRWTNNETTRKAAAEGGVKGWAAKRVAGIGMRAEKASFDIRHAPIVGKAMQQYVGSGTLTKKTTAGGLTAVMEERKKRDDATLKWLTEENPTNGEVKRKEEEKRKKQESLAMGAEGRSELIGKDAQTAKEEAKRIAKEHRISESTLNAWGQNQKHIETQNGALAADAAELRQRAEEAQKRVEELNESMGHVDRDSSGALTEQGRKQLERLKVEQAERENERQQIEAKATLVTRRSEILSNPKADAAELRQRAEEAQKRVEEIKENLSDMQRNNRGILTAKQEAEKTALETEKAEKEKENGEFATRANLLEAREDMLNLPGMREYVETEAKAERYDAFLEKQQDRAQLRHELETGEVVTQDENGNDIRTQLTSEQKQQHEARIRTLSGEISQLYGEVDRDVGEIDDTLKKLVGKQDEASKKQHKVLEAQRNAMVELFESRQEELDLSEATAQFERSDPGRAQKLKERVNARIGNASKGIDDAGVAKSAMDRIDARYEAMAKVERKETFFNSLEKENTFFKLSPNFSTYRDSYLREKREAAKRGPAEKALRDALKQLTPEEKPKEQAQGGQGGITSR